MATRNVAAVDLGASSGRVLLARFGSVPEELRTQLLAVQSQPKLKELLETASVCPDVPAFQAALAKP